MKQGTLHWLTTGLAVCLLGSAAFAQTQSESQDSSSPSGHQQNAGNTDSNNSASSGSQNRSQPSRGGASAATPTDPATGVALKAASKVGNSLKRHHPHVSMKRHRRGRNNRRGSASLNRASSNRASANAQPASDSSPANTGNLDAAQQENLGGGQQRNSSGTATQGNQPKQTANQTENNNNNSMTNRHKNISAGTVMAGLVNVNVQNVNLDIYKVIDIHNVLNNSQVELLTQKIQNSPGAQAKQDVLNNLLRDSHVLSGNKVVVGVLSSMKRILTMDAPNAAKKSAPADNSNG
jgi:hypothetical protein